MNADGSFTYVHNGSETLTDSFTYRVSDGINLSNLATVSLTITPTNDAPVIAAIAPQTVEQGRTLTFTILATDPDDSNSAPESNVVIYGLAPGAPSGTSIDPSTGIFTWAVPRTQTVGLPLSCDIGCLCVAQAGEGGMRLSLRESFGMVRTIHREVYYGSPFRKARRSGGEINRQKALLGASLGAGAGDGVRWEGIRP